MCTSEKEKVSKSNVLRKTTDSYEEADCSHEHVRATGAHVAVQCLSDLFKKRIQDDDVQDFDTRWDQDP